MRYLVSQEVVFTTCSTMLVCSAVLCVFWFTQNRWVHGPDHTGGSIMESPPLVNGNYPIRGFMQLNTNSCIHFLFNHPSLNCKPIIKGL